MSRKTNLERPTRSQRKRSGRYRESLRAKGIPFTPQRRK